MKIEFHSYDTKAELEMIRDLASAMVERYDEMNPPYTTVDPQPTDEIDSRIEVPITLPAVAPEPPTEAVAPEPPTEAVAPENVEKFEVDLDASGEIDVDPEAAPAPERDKHGRVWDERIDSSNRKMTTSGEWQKRRYVDDDVREAVIAELMAVAPSPEETFAEAATPAAPPAPAPDAAAPTTAPPPPPPATEGAGDTPAPSADLDWGEVFQRTMTAIQAQHVTQDQINAKVNEWGIDSFPGLVGHPDKFGLFLAELMID